jgi:hypothetical protein
MESHFLIVGQKYFFAGTCLPSCSLATDIRTCYNTNFSGGKWALWKIITDLVFRWSKSESNRKVLIEKAYIRAARLIV